MQPSRTNLRSTAPAAVAALLVCALLRPAMAQQTGVTEQIDDLKKAMAAAQGQILASQQQLADLQKQLNSLESQVAASTSAAANPSAETLADAVEDLRERADVQASQTATLNQTKVETESKYPFKLSGLVLWNSFTNTRAVDAPATPTIALPGAGSTGMTLRQTILGFDARGPHLLGAHSYADLRVDFDGTATPTTTAGAYSSTAISFLRLRTAHAGLRWDSTEAFFSLDRPIVSPETPTSLTAVAEPALAWAGNLWTWNPQAGAAERLPVGVSHALELQGAFIDPADAPFAAAATQTASPLSATSAENSRWPGLEGTITWLDPAHRDDRSHLGAGWYFSPHLSPYGNRYNAWAGTAYGNLLLPLRLRLTGSFYRGDALGGLGGGGFKDYAYRPATSSSGYDFRPLADVGGWAQLKEKWNERLELNAAFGLDNVLAYHLRYYAVPSNTVYQNLARNRAFTANFIYSPSNSLLFSVEYRHLDSIPVLGAGSGSDILGAAAGYRF